MTVTYDCTLLIYKFCAIVSNYDISFSMGAVIIMVEEYVVCKDGMFVSALLEADYKIH